nr:NTP transferase domain-containing protein [Bacteroidales bacterium]
MKALVFAAGLGTRLRPLTDRMPKALVCVAGEPMLRRVICKLRDAGLGPFVVNVHHFADQIERFLSEHDLGVGVAVSREVAEPLETGGGIRHAAPLLTSPEGRFLVHNVDILSDLDVRWF